MAKWWDTLKFLSVAGVGLFVDGYLNLAIGLIVPMLGYLYFADEKGSVPTVKADIIKGGLSLGMIAGQLGFGMLGDALGRKRVYGKELIITMLGTLMVIVAPKHMSHNAIVAWVSIFRVVTGIGIGGDYPMTSSLSAEHDPLRSRGKMVLLVFASIGVGAMVSGIVYLILLEAFKSAVDHNIQHLQWVWRLMLGLAIVPAAATVYSRLHMRETKPYKEFVVAKQESDPSLSHSRGMNTQFRDFISYFSNWRHATVLFATSASWFLFDIAYYGVNLNQSIILSQIGFGKGATKWDTLHNTAVGNIIVCAAGYLPGFYFAILLPDRIGRVNQQFICSALAAVLYAIWAGVTTHTSTGGLITLFTLSQFVLNSGPNATTFLIPVEVFPTRVRGTAHGISAASGKCGAVLTAFAFGSVVDSIGLRGTLGLLSGVMVLCAAVTLLIPETKGKTLEEIEAEVLYGGTLAENGASSSERSTPELKAEEKDKPTKDDLWTTKERQVAA